MNTLTTASIEKKLKLLDETVHAAMLGRGPRSPTRPARDIQILMPAQLPNKPGLACREGQIRLLHDLASIELQATELAIRSLLDFPEAPQLFREELATLALSEGRHLHHCLEQMAELGGKWGDWPTHLALWDSTSHDDDLLDRILIVHRYLEGSGLDAGANILRKLSGVANSNLAKTLYMITEEEVDHVYFGNKWFNEICKNSGLESETEFRHRLQLLFHRLPRRIERMDLDYRRRSGFSENEISELQKLRQRWLPPSNKQIFT